MCMGKNVITKKTKNKKQKTKNKNNTSEVDVLFFLKIWQKRLVAERIL